MRVLSATERSFMSNQIVSGLHRLGIEVTPRTLEAEMERMDHALGSLGIQSAPDITRSYAPPDPYAAALCQMRKEQR